MKQKTFSLKTVKKQSHSELVLGGDLSIKNAPAICKALAAADCAVEKIELNLRDVTRLDLTTIQTIAAFRNHLTENGCGLLISATLSEDIQKLMTNAGLAGIIK